MQRITTVFLLRSLLLVLVVNSARRPRAAEAAKILNIAFTGSKSHKITYEPLLYELAKRGHEVTSVGPFPSKAVKNFRNILTLGPDELRLENSLPLESVFGSKSSRWDTLTKAVRNPLFARGHHFAEQCKKSYQLPQVQGILEEKFDLVIFTPFFNECLYGLVHKLNTTVILFTQHPVFPWVSRSLGNPEPASYVPNMFSEYSDRMCFPQRLLSYVGNCFNSLVRTLYYYPMMEKVYRVGLNDPDLPSIAEIEKSVSLVLSNSHVSYASPKPLMSDVIEVGGLHLTPAKPVPKELDSFLSEARDGFILFSMGSALKGSQMPESYRKLFLNVFSKLKQRVLWKWETETMEGLPPNVKLSKWLPQQDVLGHKNIRLFITHGGHGGIQEAIYHAVPLLGIPMFGDQPGNLRRAAKLGITLPPLVFGELTEEILLNSINDMLSNPSYKETVKKLSSVFLDQPQKPLDRAVYWTEYVLRHKGAPHLRSAGRDLNFFQYHSLDVLALLLTVALISIKVSIITLKTILRLCFGSRSQASTPSVSKKVSQDKKKK